MNKQEIISRLEAFAPPETQEGWDCSGWIIEHPENNIRNVMFALTITDSVYEQAKEKNCDLIISHHPLFFVPLQYKDIQMYCAHTNLDKAKGGTTDTLIEKAGFDNAQSENEFVRIVTLKTPISIEVLKDRLLPISPHLRYINNRGVQKIQTIGFCAGSGSEFIESSHAECFVTGDLKYHTACETSKVVFDIGHFESEVIIKEKLQKITGIEGIFADEKTPFI